MLVSSFILLQLSAAVFLPQVYILNILYFKSEQNYPSFDLSEHFVL